FATSLSHFLIALYFFLCPARAHAQIYPLSLHDALPILPVRAQVCALPAPISDAPESCSTSRGCVWSDVSPVPRRPSNQTQPRDRSEEHTSELQSRENLVCRLLLEKKKKKNQSNVQLKEH